MRKSVVSTHRLVLATLALSATPALAVETFFVGGIANWNDPNNWAQVGTDGLLGTGDDVKVKPVAADVATILGGQTATINSVEAVSEVVIQHPANARDLATLPGTARLNVEAGATLTTNAANGFRLGRQIDGAQTAGTIRGEVVQTGGNVFIGTGANGLRMSAADSLTVADSLYRISGGLLRGAADASGTIVSDLRLGATGNTWGTAEFHVVGKGATAIEFLDFQMAANTNGNGTSILHFSIGANGVTPVTVYDELQFRGVNVVVGTDTIPTFGQNLLQIDLIGAPAIDTDIDLVIADRLNTNGVTNAAALERFTGMPDGTLIVREFEGSTYTYALRYVDGGDNSVLDARVYLDFVSLVAVPEPSAMAGLMAGSLALLARRRRVVGRV